MEEHIKQSNKGNQNLRNNLENLIQQFDKHTNKSRALLKDSFEQNLLLEAFIIETAMSAGMSSANPTIHNARLYLEKFVRDAVEYRNENDAWAESLGLTSFARAKMSFAAQFDRCGAVFPAGSTKFIYVVQCEDLLKDNAVKVGFCRDVYQRWGTKWDTFANKESFTSPFNGDREVHRYLRKKYEQDLEKGRETYIGDFSDVARSVEHVVNSYNPQ